MLDLQAPRLLFTYWELRGIYSILSPADFEEVEALLKDLKQILLDLLNEFPKIYGKITAAGDAVDLGFLSCLRKLRASVYDIKDILEAAATNHQMKQKLYTDGRHGKAPGWSLGSLLLPLTGMLNRNRNLNLYGRRHDKAFPSLEFSIERVKKSISDLRQLCDSSSKVMEAESIEKIGYHLAFLLRTGKITGTTSLPYYEGLEDTVVGRESEKKQVLDWIFNPSSDCQHLNVISINGHGGTGKTTLAKIIYNDDVHVSTSFDLVLWVDVASCAFVVDLDLKSLLVEIVRSFSNQSWYELQRMDSETLKRRLHVVLQDRKYLLVLDGYDFGGQAEWEKLRKILKVGSAGSTVIVTSKLEWIGTTQCLWLRGLLEKDCWSLLTKCAGFGLSEEVEQEYPFLKGIRGYIVNKCHGSPLLIKTLGSTLRATRDEHQWKQIHQTNIWTEPAWYISLEHMPFDMARCFVGSAILPRTKAMSRDQLVYFWMAQGLLQSKESNEEPRDIGVRYCTELLSRAFLQSYQTNGHDIILQLRSEARHLALDTMQEEVAVLRAASFPENSRHLIWNGEQIFSEKEFAHCRSALPRASTFLLGKYVGRVSKRFLEELISKLTHARVLLLDGSEFKALPESIGNLKLLRYFSLAGNHTLRRLPNSICNLLNLQTLDLSGCQQLQTLPKYMDQLSNLRHLLLSVKVATLPEAIKSLTSLYHLKICNCPELRSISVGIAHLTALRVLQIHDCPLIASLPDNIKQLTSLKELSIRNCAQLDLTNWDGLEGFKILQFLQFQGLPRLSKFPKGFQSAADSLRHLLVSNCTNLTALPECLQTCTNLLELVIDYCPNMGTLPKGIQAIKALQLLKIVNCPTLISSCQRETGEDWHLISHIPKIQLRIRTEKHPGSLSGEKRLGKQQPEVKQDDLPRAGTSFQEEGYNSQEEIIVSGAPTTGRLDVMAGSADSSQSLVLKEEYNSQEEIIVSGAPRTGSLDGMEGSVLKSGVMEGSVDSSQSLVLKEEGLLAEACVEEEVKDWCSILFLLPENYEIEKDTLIQLWMAGKYITDEPMELKGEQYFRFMLDNEYLFPSGANFMTGKGTYRVNIKKVNKLQVDYLENNVSSYIKWDKDNQYPEGSSRPAAESIQHVSLVRSDTDETDFQALQQFNKLRTVAFLANRGHRVKHIPDHLFSGLKNLQALCLSRTHIRELPSSVGQMIQLRYLDLSWTLIEWLPDAICFLVELQTLKLRGCSNLRDLPQQLPSLTKLRYLDVDVLRQLETMPKGIGALVNLRTLPAFLVGTEDGCKIQELNQLNNLSGFLCIAKLEHVESAEEASEAALDKKKHLQKLELRWTASELSGTHNNSYDILEGLQPCTSLEELQILCYEGSTFPRWISDVQFDHLARVVFYRCENLSELPLIEQLPHLKYLQLFMMNSVEKIERRGELEKAAFPELEKLEINDMQSLKVWDWTKMNDSDFKSLAQLIINDCPELEEFDVLPHLSSLKHFDIRECPKLESLSNTEVPKSLEKLIVEDCPQIQKRCSENDGVDWNKKNHVPTICIQKEKSCTNDMHPESGCG